jgi:hypothetical protein
MINDLVSKLKDRHYAELIAKGKLVCPDCGAAASHAPDAGASTMRCARCRTTASLEEWSRAGRDGLMVGDADSPPPDTKIVRSMDGGTTAWYIPASGKGCFFLFFASIWLFITAMVTMPMIFSLISDPTKRNGEIPGWGLIAFLSLFWIIGLGVLYLGLRGRYARHLLTVDGTVIKMSREMFGRVSEKTIALDEVVRVTQKEFYQKNYQPVFGIEIEGKRSKLRFGSALEDDEKAWLVADLRRAVAQPVDILPPMAPQPAASPEPGSPSAFSFVLESPARIMLVPSLVGVVAGLVFMGIGIWIISRFGTSSLRDFGGVDIFGGFWLLISAGVTFSSASMVLFALRNRGTEIHIKGDATNVSVSTIKHGRAIKEDWYSRSEITGASAVTRGQFETTEMKRLVLLVGLKKVEIAKWVPAGEADDLVRGMNEALGMGKNGG